MATSQPTIYDIARLAGVSPASVSLALRNEGTLSQKTRSRIVKIARQMHYRRNVFAASLRSRNMAGAAKGMPLAVFTSVDKTGMTYPVQPLINGIHTECARLGFLLHLESLDDDTPLRSLLRSLYHRGVQGIFLPHTLDATRVSQQEWARFSVVSCNRGGLAPLFHTVRASAFDVVVRAVEKIHSRGYKRIGGALFRHSPPVLDDIAREAAFCWAVQHHGLELLPLHLGGHSDRDAFIDWLEKNRPDAVLAFHVGCYYWMQQSKAAKKRRTGFCTLHHEPIPGNEHISGFHSPDGEIGRSAVILMDTLIRHHERGIPSEVRETLLTRRWHPGKTLPKRGRSANFSSASKSSRSTDSSLPTPERKISSRSKSFAA